MFGYGAVPLSIIGPEEWLKLVKLSLSVSLVMATEVTSIYQSIVVFRTEKSCDINRIFASCKIQ